MAAKRTHGLTRTPIHDAWLAMRWRTRHHRHYAAVGIDPRWSTFEGFRDNPPTVADGHDFKPGMHLARVNDSGDYGPENARWRTPEENQREMNERRMLRLDDGRFAWDVARENGICRQTMHTRLRRGWPLSRAVGLDD